MGITIITQVKDEWWKPRRTVCLSEEEFAKYKDLVTGGIIQRSRKMTFTETEGGEIIEKSFRIRSTPVIRKVNILGTILGDFVPHCVVCGKGIEDSDCMEIDSLVKYYIHIGCIFDIYSLVREYTDGN